jgi:DNA-binding transcriptional LysR family regulator
MPLSAHVPELTALEVLLAVARTGSLNGAAQEVGVSQQAVSARIRSVEAQTGVVLVIRTAHGSRLTDEGVVVAEWAARVLDAAAQLDAGLGALRHDRRTHLRVSASLTIAEQLLPAWLVSFRATTQHASGPAAEIVLTAVNSDTVITHVTDGTADIGFIEGPRLPKSLRSKVIAHDQLAVTVPRGHPWTRRRGAVSAAELASTPLVSREEGSGTRDALTAALIKELGPGVRQAQPALSLSTTAAVRAAVRAGAGPAVLSEMALAGDLSDGSLVRVEIPELDLHRKLRAVWRGPKVPPAGAARDLVTHILGRRR